MDGFKKKYSTNCVLNDYSQRVTVDKIRYQEIDAIDHYDLYKQNNIIDKILDNKKLIEYGYDIEKYKNHKLHLYIRTHFGFDYDCLKDLGFETDWLVYMYGQADNMIMFGKFTLSSIAIIGTSILNMFSFFHTSLEFLIKYSINIFSSTSLFVYCLFAKRYDDYYEKKMTCSDVITNNNYNIMIYKIKRSGKIIIALLIIYILVFVVNIVALIIQLRLEKKKTINDDIKGKNANKEQNVVKKEDKELNEFLGKEGDEKEKNKPLMDEEENILN